MVRRGGVDWAAHEASLNVLLGVTTNCSPTVKARSAGGGRNAAGPPGPTVQQVG